MTESDSVGLKLILWDGSFCRTEDDFMRLKVISLLVDAIDLVCGINFLRTAVTRKRVANTYVANGTYITKYHIYSFGMYIN